MGGVRAIVVLNQTSGGGRTHLTEHSVSGYLIPASSALVKLTPYPIIIAAFPLAIGCLAFIDESQTVHDPVIVSLFLASGFG